ncbi:MAG: alpha/beta fold hydrolase BchO [Pseudomonadota bacterium]
MDWASEAETWPFSDNSRFVKHAPHEWHVQDLGDGPIAVLIHGTGGATQSFRNLVPRLAKHFRMIMVDLPGQGFTKMGTRQRCGLHAMSDDLLSLMTAIGVEPDLYVAHSAGAAIALNMSRQNPTPVFGINPALGHFDGAAGWLFPMLAKLLVLNPFVPGLFASMAKQPGRIEGLLKSTGSSLDPTGTDLYRRLITNRNHVDGALLMMAQWSIDGLLERLPEVAAPVFFLTAERDGAVPPKVAVKAAEQLSNATVKSIPGEGHLLHETAPDLTAQEILTFYETCQSTGPSSA